MRQFDAMFRAVEAERLANGFSHLVVAECDPRQAGGKAMFLGVKDGSIWWREMGQGEYEEVAADDLRYLYPHARFPDLTAVL